MIDALIEQARSLQKTDAAQAYEAARKAADLADAAGRRDQQAKAICIQAAIVTEKSVFDEALNLYTKALDLFEEQNNILEAARTLGELGYIQYNQSNYRLALDYARRSLVYYTDIGDSKGQATENSRLGTLMQHLGNLPQALEYLLRSFELHQTIDNKEGLAACLNNLALVYKDLGQSDKALEYYRRCLDICREIDNHSGEAMVYCNMGVVYDQLGQKDEALQQFMQTLELARKNNDRRQETIALTNIGDLQLHMGEFEKAFETFQIGLELARKISLHRSETYALLGLGRCCYLQERFEESAEYLEQAKQYVEESGVLALQAVLYSALMELHESQGNCSAALEYCRRSFAVERETISKRADEKLQNLQILHETEQARKEAEIQRLENVELAAANDRLEQMVRSKNEFLGIAAHDLRNPLSNIKGLARIVKVKSAQLTPADISDMCGDIEASSERILKLVAELLEINRIDQGRLKVKAALFDVSQTTERYLSVYSECAAGKNIHLKYEGPSSGVWAYADRDIIVQVLDNLTSNAVKFSPRDTTVTIVVKTVETPGFRRARIEVRDEGPGIAADEIPLLFGKFVRLSARPTGGEESTGLGLSIVKQLVEAMQGRVWCESVLGEGAAFFVELPIEQTIGTYD